MKTISIIIDIIFKIVMLLYIINQMRLNRDFLDTNDEQNDLLEKLIESDLYIKKLLKKHNEVEECKKKRKLN